MNENFPALLEKKLKYIRFESRDVIAFSVTEKAKKIREAITRFFKSQIKLQKRKILFFPSIMPSCLENLFRTQAGHCIKKHFEEMRSRGD